MIYHTDVYGISCVLDAATLNTGLRNGHDQKKGAQYWGVQHEKGIFGTDIVKGRVGYKCTTVSMHSVFILVTRIEYNRIEYDIYRCGIDMEIIQWERKVSDMELIKSVHIFRITLNKCGLYSNYTRTHICPFTRSYRVYTL